MSFTEEGLVVGLRRRRGRLVCPCGRVSRSYYDSSRRRWRHLDFGACKVFLEAEVHRIDCPACGRVRTEQVPWGRPGARHTRDFDDVAAWFAQRMDKTSVARLLRCSWEAVDHIVDGSWSNTSTTPAWTACCVSGWPRSPTSAATGT